ncbi:MAG: helix-turn-helix domain-containing protein [Pseudorhodoplanes sp.]
MTLAENVRKFRKLADLSQKALADRIGVRQNTIAAIESGETRRTKFLPDLARVLNVSVSDLEPSAGGGEPLIPAADLIGARDLDLYGSVEAGEGGIVLSNEPVDKIRRPAPLANVRGGYGVIVVGESMVPLLRPGDIVLVNPHLPPKIEDLCLFICDAEAEFKATIKEFRGHSKDAWKVRRYQPAERDYLLKKADFPKCEVVVGVYKRR